MKRVKRGRHGSTDTTSENDHHNNNNANADNNNNNNNNSGDHDGDGLVAVEAAPIGYYVVGGLFMMCCVFAYTYDLETRMFHHDEGSNYLFLPDLFHYGRFVYDPFNYHGPLLFFLMKWVVHLNIWWNGYESGDFIRGASPVCLRLIPVFGGLLLLLCIWLLLRHRIGWFGSLCALLLAGLNMEIFWVSRYFIHEIFLVLFTLTLYVTCSMYMDATARRRKWLLYGISASLAGLVVTKEVCPYHIIVLVMADVCSKVGQEMLTLGTIDPRRMQGKFDPRESPLFAGYKELLKSIDVRHAAMAYVSCFVIPVGLFYTSGGTNFDGVRAIMVGYFAWGCHAMSNAQGHGKPTHYFVVDILHSYSSTLWVLSMYSFGLAMYERHRHGLMLAFWSTGTILMYSVAHYKTPWCAPNLVMPMFVLCGWGLNQSFKKLQHVQQQREEYRQRKAAERRRMSQELLVTPPTLHAAPTGEKWQFGLVMIMLTVLTMLDGYAVYDLSFVRPDSGMYPHNYAQTFQKGREVVDLLEYCESRNNVGDKLRLRAVLKSQAHPLGYYIRRYRNLVWFDEHQTKSPDLTFQGLPSDPAHVVLGDEHLADKIVHLSPPEEWSRTRIRFSDTSSIDVYLHRFRCQHQNGDDLPVLQAMDDAPTDLVPGVMQLEWTSMPVYAGFDNVIETRLSELKIEIPERTAALGWKAWLDVPMSGLYEFEMLGASIHWRMALDDVLIVSNSGVDVHAPRNAIGKRFLEQGKHKLYMEYAHEGRRGKEGMQLRWKQPHFNAEFHPLDPYLFVALNT